MRNNVEIPVPSIPAMSELELRLPDGGSWTLCMSPAMERFIGRYPRLPEFAPEGGLISYRRTPVSV